MRRPSYILQMHVGGCRRRRIFDIEFISRTIRCDATSTDEHSSGQWLVSLNEFLWAQPCERGAAPHPRPSIQRWLPRRGCHKLPRFDHRTPTSSTLPLPNHSRFFCQYLRPAQPCFHDFIAAMYSLRPGYRPIVGEDFLGLGRAAMTPRSKDPSKRARHVGNCTGLHENMLRKTKVLDCGEGKVGWLG
jgi:hypothetical protein